MIKKLLRIINPWLRIKIFAKFYTLVILEGIFLGK